MHSDRSLTECDRGEAKIVRFINDLLHNFHDLKLHQLGIQKVNDRQILQRSFESDPPPSGKDHGLRS